MSVTSEYPVTNGTFKASDKAYGTVSPISQVAGYMTLATTNYDGVIDQQQNSTDHRVWKMHFPTLTAGNGYKFYVNNTLVADNVTVTL
jgi:hypothetical protein